MNYNHKSLYFFNKKGHQQNLSWNGKYWEGRTLLPKVSENLFEIEHIFMVQKFNLVTTGEIKYGVPHTTAPDSYGNPWGITAKFTSGSYNVVLSSPISSDLVGATVFSDYVYGAKITAISGNTITLDQSSYFTGNSDISFTAWRARFETPYNIIDFDGVPNLTAKLVSGQNYLTTSADISEVKPGYIITGEGLEEGTRIVSITGNKININKTLKISNVSASCWIYEVEDVNDVSGRLYQYTLLDDPDYVYPVLLNVKETYIPIDWETTDSLTGEIYTVQNFDSSSRSVNIALNSDQEAIIGRSLIIEDICQEEPVIIFRMEFIGEVIGEDPRYNKLLENLGHPLYKEDFNILRDTDPEEPYPDYQIINNKRKELLIEGHEIFPYIGSYKGLINIIKAFGYQDLRIKEYWLNIQKTSATSVSSFQQNEELLNKIKNTPYGESVLIDNLLDDENSGKYKQIEVYGKLPDGTYGLKSAVEQIFPSTSYKKTPLFGLFYDLNQIVDNEEDEWGYPITQDAFVFSPEEVLIKLFALKEKLKKDYLPLSAKIIDITGEGFYFSVNKTRGWVDTLKIDEIQLGMDVDVSVTPSIGYIEDLRTLQLRTNPSLPQLPFVPGYEGNSDVSVFGNISDPNPYSQYYTPAQSEALITAIEGYYVNLKDNKSRLDLGDGDYDGPGYNRYSDGSKYYLPAGFPTILEVTSFRLSWDDLQVSWNNIGKDFLYHTSYVKSIGDMIVYEGDTLITNSFVHSIDLDSVLFNENLNVVLPTGFGDFLDPILSGSNYYLVQVRLESGGSYVLAEVSAYNDITGAATLKVLWKKGSGEISNWSVNITNLFSSRQEIDYYNWSYGLDGFYSWDNLRFVGYYEIEWTVSKDGEVPYFFQMRGNLKDYWKLPHFLPYIGEYSVKCRIWNSFNDVSIGYFNNVIKVEPRSIELTSVTRFRQAEEYTWDQMVLTWEDYDSQWNFPIEQQREQPQPSQRVLTYAEYGNQFNDGQECKVLKTFNEVRGSLTFNMGVVKHQITGITSTYPTGLGPAIVTTADAHGLLAGNKVWIEDLTAGGEYSVLSIISSTEFTIPLLLSSPLTPLSSYMSGPGTINISVSGREYLTVNYGGSIGSMSAQIYSGMNGLVKDPHFTIKSYEPVVVIGAPPLISFYEIVVLSPENTGDRFNGQIVNILSTGSIVLNKPDTILTPYSLSPAISGGANQYEDYVYYSPGDDLPIPAMKDWGTKQMNWDSLSDISWDQLYSQTLPMFDYHQDFLGGFDLYNVRYGDQIKVGKNTEGIVIGINGSPTSNMLLTDVAEQLNSSNDPGISKFTYTVRGYSRIGGSSPVTTDIGPVDEDTLTYSGFPFTATSLYRGNHGEIFMSSGTEIKIFYSPYTIDTINLDYTFDYLQVDRKDRIWCYGTGAVPLQIVDLKHPDRKIAFISETGSSSGYYKDVIIPASFVSASIKALAIDDRKDDFAISINYGSGNVMLYYDGGRQEFDSFTVADGLPSVDIRQMVFDYKGGKKTLWIATGSGLSVYDRIKFFNYRTTNSGLFSNNVYSICIDEISNKWIGTDAGITYYDGETWAVWNAVNSPELPSGVDYTNIITTGYGNIFFALRDTMGNTKLGYFNGDNFNIYTNDPGTSDVFDPYLTPTNHYENTWMIFSNVKSVEEDYTQFPGNIFYLDNSNNLRQIDFVIPHIHACSKYSGNEGWDFVYYTSSRSLPSISQYPLGVGYGIIDFNFIVGPINSNYILSDLFRPKFPFVDGYSWKAPDWTPYDFSGVLSVYPELNRDHLFLDAPLRDILNGNALKEEYWRNPPIERIADKKSRDQFSDFEWLIRLGDSNDDRGLKVIVGKDGYIYVMGYFRDTVYFGSPNNVNAGTFTTLNSPGRRSAFVAKYNSVGIIQWARMYGEGSGSPVSYIYDYTPTSIKLDSLGNVYLVGYRENNTTTELPSNFLIRWDWNGTFVSYTQLFTPSSSTAFDESFDVVVDDVNNLYISGEYKGTLTTGTFTLNNPDSRPRIYVAKVESTGYVTYLKDLGGSNGEYNPALALGNFNDLYIAYNENNGSDSYMKLRSYNALSFDLLWEKSIANTGGTAPIISPDMDLSKGGNLVIGFEFDGNLSIESTSLDSVGTKDIALFKFLTTGNLLWGKIVGSTYGNSVHSIKIDDEERIYLLCSFSGEFFVTSPDPIIETVGGLDILLLKMENDGRIIDQVTIGSISDDEGIAISLDQDRNIYLTGYLSGQIDTGKYVTSPTVGNSKDIFIGKIPSSRFIPGKSCSGPMSWVGTQTWGWSDKRIHSKEFEIPVGSTVVINPLDSNIPGKNGHKWKLFETSTGNKIVDIKDVQYFIWNFKTPGYYDLVLEVKDTNGNVYTTEKKGYIRVVDHKKIFEGEAVPHKINSNDFIKQSVYGY